MVVATTSGYGSGTIGVRLNPGQQLGEANIVLVADAGTIHVTIKSSSTGTSLSGADVIVLNENGLPIISLPSGQDGVAIIRNLAPGTYTVSIKALGYAFQSFGAMVAADEIEYLDVELAPGFGTINGAVVDEVGQPITSALPSIQLLLISQTIVQTVLAEPSGRFYFVNVPPGQYFIKSSVEGYEVKTVPVTVIAEQHSEVLVQLQAAVTEVVGIVVDAQTTQALSGALIKFFDGLSGVFIAQTVSGLDGTFSFRRLPVGTMIVTASAEGYGAVSRAVITRSGQVVQTRLELVAAPGLIIGTVADEAGNPIGGAGIEVLDSTRAVIKTVLTDSFGDYEVSNLAPGRYMLIFSHQGYSRMFIGAVVEAAQITNVNAVLMKENGTVAGVITDTETGKPLPGVAIQLRFGGAAGAIAANTLTDADGQYTVAGLPVGFYLVRASLLDYGSESATIELQSERESRQDFYLSSNPGTVRGRVINATDGTPLIDVTIRLSEISGAVLLTTQTDIDGRFEVAGFKAGTYLLTAYRNGFSGDQQSFTVARGGVAEVSFALAGNPGRLAGTVRRRMTEQPIPGAVVAIYLGNPQPFLTTVTDSSGAFSVAALRPGPYTVRVTAANFVSWSEAATVRSDETSEVAFVLDPAPASINGMVISSSGGPVNDASVEAYSSRRLLLGRGVSDQEGHFALGNLPFAEVLTMDVLADGYRDETLRLVMEQNERRELTITLYPVGTGDVYGRVVMEGTRAPVSGAAILIRRADRSLVGERTSNSSGYFEMRGLTPGVYKGYVVTTGGAKTAFRFEIVPDETTVVTAILRQSVPPAPPAEPLGTGSRVLIILDGSDSPLALLSSATNPTEFELLLDDPLAGLMIFQYEMANGEMTRMVADRTLVNLALID